MLAFLSINKIARQMQSVMLEFCIKVSLSTRPILPQGHFGPMVTLVPKLLCPKVTLATSSLWPQGHWLEGHFGPKGTGSKVTLATSSVCLNITLALRSLWCYGNFGPKVNLALLSLWPQGYLLQGHLAKFVKIWNFVFSGFLTTPNFW